MVTTVRKKMWPWFPLGPWPPSRTRVLASGEVAVTEESYPPAGRAPLQAVGSLPGHWHDGYGGPRFATASGAVCADQQLGGEGRPLTPSCGRSRLPRHGRRRPEPAVRLTRALTAQAPLAPCRCVPGSTKPRLLWSWRAASDTHHRGVVDDGVVRLVQVVVQYVAQ